MTESDALQYLPCSTQDKALTEIITHPHERLCNSNMPPVASNGIGEHGTRRPTGSRGASPHDAACVVVSRRQHPNRRFSITAHPFNSPDLAAKPKRSDPDETIGLAARPTANRVGASLLSSRLKPNPWHQITLYSSLPGGSCTSISTYLPFAR